MNTSEIVVATAARRELGGLPIRRVLPALRQRALGPFVFVDHMGRVDLPPAQGVDVPPHPHIGLATLTWLFEGELVHRDSLGFEQAIAAGAVNWMSAGSGIVHSERSSEHHRATGSKLHGLQTWVALPADQEESAPSFQHYPTTDIPRIQGEGFEGRLIAGRAWGHESPVAVDSPLFCAELLLAAGAGLQPPKQHEQRGAYLVQGDASVAGMRLEAGQLAVWQHSSDTPLLAHTDCRVMCLGGTSLGRRHMWWNFVSTRPERIEQARRDWEHDRFGSVPGDNERVLLPESGFRK